MPDKNISTMSIDLEECKTVDCPNCGHNTFDTVSIIYRISGLLVGKKSDAFLKLYRFKCSECGHVLNEPNDPVPPTPAHNPNITGGIIT